MIRPDKSFKFLLIISIFLITSCEYTLGTDAEEESIISFEELTIDRDFNYSLIDKSNVIIDNGIADVYSYSNSDTTYLGTFSNGIENAVLLEGASIGLFHYMLPNSLSATNKVLSNNKIIICHIPPGNPDNRKTIEISTSAWEAHRDNHGDYLGACSNNSFDDSDGDGVVDYIDEYPEDSNFAYTSYFPGENEKATLLFEDMWPLKGDYDFNDLVVYYNLRYKKNADNKIVGIDYTYNIAAIGGIKNSSFYVRLLDNNLNPFPQSIIESVSGNDLSQGFASVRANGTEQGTNEAVIPVIDNTRNAFVGINAGTTVNVIEEEPIIDSETNTISILFNKPYNENEVYFDPFIVTDFNREAEIHLSVFGPTDRAINSGYFGTEDDNSDLAKKYFYKSTEHYPWALNVPREIVYPKENTDFAGTYIEFSEWAESTGKSRKNWYFQENGKYHSHKVYKKRK